MQYKNKNDKKMHIQRERERIKAKKKCIENMYKKRIENKEVNKRKI